MHLHTTVLIVGAGPAGCSTSFFLSKAGIPHVIIDKAAAFPRDKVCGDAVSGKSVYVLRNVDEPWLNTLRTDGENVYSTFGLSFVAPNGKGLSIPFGKDKDGLSPGFTATRLFLDDYLFKKLDPAFATVQLGSTLNSLQRSGDNWTASLQTPGGMVTVTASMIVAADGDKGSVRKLLGLQDTDLKTSAVGLRAYYSNVAPPTQGAGDIELHFLPELLPGYFWIFPLGNGRANVGLGMLSKDVRDKKINLRESMLHAIANNPTLSHRFKDAKLEGKILGWGLPMGMERRPASGEGYILTGDAAQLIDPFSGEGIGNALYSGMKAAQAIVEANKTDDFSAKALKALYDAPLYKRLWGELQTSIILQRLSRYPWLFNFIINKANRSPTLKSTISGMFTDLDLRKKLRQPGFYLRMLVNR